MVNIIKTNGKDYFATSLLRFVKRTDDQGIVKRILQQGLVEVPKIKLPTNSPPAITWYDVPEFEET